MYLPPHFTETDRAEIDALVDSCPLAALVVATDKGDPVSYTHLTLPTNSRV